MVKMSVNDSLVKNENDVNIVSPVRNRNIYPAGTTWRIRVVKAECFESGVKMRR